MYVDTKLRPQGEQVDAVAPTKLKLSAAIRIGARLRPQCSGKFFSEGGSCAMGAAMEAVGISYDESSGTPHQAVLKFPELFIATTGKTFTALAKRIYMLNDHENLSREQIAAWLEAQGL